MVFNSLPFAVFLPLVFCGYWFLFQRDVKAQNLFVVFASYFFYGWWDWRFLVLIALSTLVDFFVGQKLTTANGPRRKWLLACSLLFNLGLLGFFKYCNFFIDSATSALNAMGVAANPTSLNLILPVGISFYTFQTLSYTIDVYREKIEPCKDLVSFAAYVSFFPQLVAGPIERATNLLPQFYRSRQFDTEQAKDGLRQILWGLLKKVVIADNCAGVVNRIFENYETLPASALVLGAIYFAFQIYGDFSGYSDIAIGTAKLFGFDLMRNFAYPYFSRDIAEFWRRWHISLSTWFREYVYVPLGGSRGSRAAQFRNVLIVFVVSGLWHGANWTFVFWGLLNGLFFLPLMFAGSNRRNLDTVAAGKLLPSTREAAQILLTFGLTCLAWIFFRAESISHAFDYIVRIFDVSLFSRPEGIRTLPLCLAMLCVEWIQREKAHALEVTGQPVAVRWAIYYAVIAAIIALGEFGHHEFIYFQF